MRVGPKMGPTGSNQQLLAKRTQWVCRAATCLFRSQEGASTSWLHGLMCSELNTPKGKAKAFSTDVNWSSMILCCSTQCHGHTRRTHHQWVELLEPPHCRACLESWCSAGMCCLLVIRYCLEIWLYMKFPMKLPMKFTMKFILKQCFHVFPHFPCIFNGDVPQKAVAQGPLSLLFPKNYSISTTAGNWILFNLASAQKLGWGSSKFLAVSTRSFWSSFQGATAMHGPVYE